MIRERACVRIDTIKPRCCIFIGVVAIRQVQCVESMSLSTYIERWKRVYIYILYPPRTLDLSLPFRPKKGRRAAFERVERE